MRREFVASASVYVTKIVFVQVCPDISLEIRVKGPTFGIVKVLWKNWQPTRLVHDIYKIDGRISNSTTWLIWNFSMLKKAEILSINQQNKEHIKRHNIQETTKVLLEYFEYTIASIHWWSRCICKNEKKLIQNTQRRETTKCSHIHFILDTFMSWGSLHYWTPKKLFTLAWKLERHLKQWQK